MTVMLLALDPSIRRNNLGYALFSNHLPHHSLIKWGVIDIPRSLKTRLDWVTRVDAAVISVLRLSQKFRVTHCIIELPRIIPTTNAQSKFKAAANTNSISNLIFEVASIRQALLTLQHPNQSSIGVNVHLVTPTQWKGQVPKEITSRRVQRKYPQTTQIINHNILDAIALGDWFLRTRLNPNPRVQV